jgi:hypothetical protein
MKIMQSFLDAFQLFCIKRKQDSWFSCDFNYSTIVIEHMKAFSVLTEPNSTGLCVTYVFVFDEHRPFLLIIIKKQTVYEIFLVSVCSVSVSYSLRRILILRIQSRIWIRNDKELFVVEWSASKNGLSGRIIYRIIRWILRVLNLLRP